MIIQGDAVVKTNLSIAVTKDGAIPIVVSGTLTISSGSALDISLQQLPSNGKVQIAQAGSIEGEFSSIRVVVASQRRTCTKTHQTLGSLTVIMYEQTLLFFFFLFSVMCM